MSVSKASSTQAHGQGVLLFSLAWQRAKTNVIGGGYSCLLLPWLLACSIKYKENSFMSTELLLFLSMPSKIWTGYPRRQQGEVKYHRATCGVTDTEGD